MTGLAAWLLEQIAEDVDWLLVGDHDRAGLCGCGEGSKDDPRLPDCLDRIMAECEAKRLIVGLHQETRTVPVPVFDEYDDGWATRCAGCGQQPGRCSTLRLLAVPYSDRPGYLEVWRP